MLAIERLSIAFAGLKALVDVSFEVRPGSIVGLIGPNGAGKSTLLNCVSRLYQPDEGSIRFDGHDLLRTKPHDIVRLGICRTFQNLELFRTASVRENVILGGAYRCRPGLLTDLLALPASRRAQREAAARADAILRELALDAYADSTVSALPYGTQKTVELARSLASDPRLMLLDEPAAGMNPEETRRLAQTILGLRDQRGITILLVEHDMRLVMAVCDHIVVLDHGEKICEGPPAVVRADPAVIQAYLGEEEGVA